MQKVINSVKVPSIKKNVKTNRGNKNGTRR